MKIDIKYMILKLKRLRPGGGTINTLEMKVYSLNQSVKMLLQGGSYENI